MYLFVYTFTIAQLHRCILLLHNKFKVEVLEIYRKQRL